MNEWQEQVVRARSGDLEAFEQVVRRFQHMAVGYAYSVLGDFAQAEDAAQEAFIQAYRDLAMLREPQAFPAWFRRVVFKHCDRARRRRFLPAIPLDADLDLADPGRTPLEALQQQETHDEVLAALRALPEHERTATALFYIDGYSLAEVGEFLEVPVGTVKKRLHTARRRLYEGMVGTMGESLKQHAPGKGFGRRVREVLEGVPYVGFKPIDGGPRGCYFAASLQSCLRYLGEDCSYTYLMGTSGAAFRLLWGEWRWLPWDLGNDTLMIAADPAEPFRRAMQAAGYGHEIILKEEFAQQIGFTGACNDDRAHFLERIDKSLRRGRPVIGFGVVCGPPECGVVAGYDEGGEVLIGWHFFQEFPNAGLEFEPNGYFRKRNWFTDTAGLLIIGEKQERPPLSAIYRRALEWAVELARTPLVHGRHAGLAAYTAWAEALLHDEDFPAGDLGLLDGRHMCHYDAMVAVTEGRSHARDWLTEIAAHEPAMAAELLKAATCYQAEWDLIWPAWELAGGIGRSLEMAQKLAEPEVRRRIAPLILQARDKDEEAIGHIERALGG